jgi:hypothetical protein
MLQVGRALPERLYVWFICWSPQFGANPHLMIGSEGETIISKGLHSAGNRRFSRVFILANCFGWFRTSIRQAIFLLRT